VLLGRWQLTKGLPDNLRAEQKRLALQALAAHMMQEEIRDISSEAALKILRPTLVAVGLEETKIETFLVDTQAGSGLLLERETDSWSFAHLTFQEYLTSNHWIEEKQSHYWGNLVSKSWWHETLRLYAAIGDASHIVKACLNDGSILALTLMADCLEEARKLDAKVRQEAERKLTEDLESPELERRKLAAEVRLALRLKSFQRLEDNREIDPNYLTWAEYQLFLDETSDERQNYLPDHCVDYPFPTGTALEPVIGVQPTDVEFFCEWLNARLGGTVTYRLPDSTKSDEIQPIKPVNQTQLPLSFWASSNLKTFNLVGLNPSQSQAFMNQAANFNKANLPLLSRFITILDLALDHPRNLDHILVFDLDLVFSLNLILALKQASYHAVYLRSYSDVELIFSLDLTLALDRTLYRYRARYLDLDLANLKESIKNNDLAKALEIAKKLQSDENISTMRLGTLVVELLEAAQATTFAEARYRRFKYLARIFEYGYIGYEDLKRPDSRTWWIKWLPRGKAGDYREERQRVLELYWWAQITLGRMEGKLPAWEGIRLVRETTDPKM
jgi:hypothetical protein